MRENGGMIEWLGSSNNNALWNVEKQLKAFTVKENFSIIRVEYFAVIFENFCENPSIFENNGVKIIFTRFF